MRNAPLTADDADALRTAELSLSSAVPCHNGAECVIPEWALRALANTVRAMSPPPDAAEIDEIGTLLNHETVPHCCGCWVIQYGNNDVVLRARCNECGKTVDLLSLLTTPPDVAVRQAVEYLSSGWGEGSEASRFKAHVDTLIRAVQAPRLTEEQVKEAYLDGYEDGNEDGRALTGCRNVCEHTPRYDPDTAWAKSDTRAAFPEAFAGEVGNG